MKITMHGAVKEFEELFPELQVDSFSSAHHVVMALKHVKINGVDFSAYRSVFRDGWTSNPWLDVEFQRLVIPTPKTKEEIAAEESVKKAEEALKAAKEVLSKVKEK